MRRTALPTRIGLVLAGVLLLAPACRRRPQMAVDAKSRAESIADLAATPEQKRLWREAAQRGAAPGLEKLTVPARGVEARAPVAVPNQAPSQTPGFVFAPGVTGAVRVVEAPRLGSQGFAGKARVTAVAGERIDIDLGQNRTLSFYARADGLPIPVQVGDSVDLTYRARSNPRNAQQILVLRTDAGRGIASVVDSGKTPVAVQVPYFNITATQTPPIDGGTMPVLFQAQTEKASARPGEAVKLPSQKLTAMVVGSFGYAGSDTGRLETSPYSVNFVLWPSP